MVRCDVPVIPPTTKTITITVIPPTAVTITITIKIKITVPDQQRGRCGICGMVLQYALKVSDLYDYKSPTKMLSGVVIYS